jgi:CheY-like chemotaxis protein/two-component sensor histidine kinase
MSHELRTPLNSLLVLAEQLEDNPEGNLTERQVQFAHVIRSSGVDLLKLLNDILDLAKVESNTVHLEISELPLADLRDAMLQAFQPVADEQGLAFSVELDDKLPATMTTDPLRLRQVLKNLMSNAFKFTSRGEVAMRLELSTEGWKPTNERLEAADSVIALRISDTGIGIRDDMHAPIFEAFAQADGSTAREYGGTGLGLSISRNLVELLGGEIALVSELGGGSTFTVFLPLTGTVADGTAVAADMSITPEAGELIASLPMHVANGKPAAVGNGKPAAVTNGKPTPTLASSDEHEFYKGSAAGSTVLIVDDDFRNIFALTALLERGEILVVAAESGAEAIAALESNREIDIVLMDIMMPDMDGYETTKEIRKRPELVDIPIIAVTGKVVGGERERCLAAGASDYIPKPVETAELLAALAKWFPLRPAIEDSSS